MSLKNRSFLKLFTIFRALTLSEISKKFSIEGCAWFDTISRYARNHSPRAHLFQKLPNVFLLLWCLSTGTYASAVRIMLNATSLDASNSYTLNVCQQIKKKLRATAPEIDIILAQKTSTAAQLQELATLANTLSIDFFVSIAITENHTIRDAIDIFTFAPHAGTTPVPDGAHPWVSYADAHAAYQQASNRYAQIIADTIAENKQINCHGPFALPYKLLQGIQVPACAIECSIKNSFTLDYMIDAIVAALRTIVAQQEIISI